MAASMSMRGLLRQASLNRPLVVFSRNAFFSRKKKTVDPEIEEAIEKSENIVEKRKHDQRIDGARQLETVQSIRDKGGVRTTPGYKPPKNLTEQMQQIVTQVCGVHGDWRRVSLADPLTKFQVLNQCREAFNHNIPNNLLSEMKTVDDAVKFYETEVKCTSALEDLSKLDLPPNLHIQMDYHRFDPETDTMFGGVTAFPQSDTKVVSLKFREKYKSVKNTKERPGYYN